MDEPNDILLMHLIVLDLYLLIGSIMTMNTVCIKNDASYFFQLLCYVPIMCFFMILGEILQCKNSFGQ